MITFDELITITYNFTLPIILFIITILFFIGFIIAMIYAIISNRRNKEPNLFLIIKIAISSILIITAILLVAFMPDMYVFDGKDYQSWVNKISLIMGAVLMVVLIINICMLLIKKRKSTQS